MKLSSADALRQRSQAKARRPFPTLIRLFIDRIFHGGDSGEDDLDVSLGLILTLLALPGGFYSIFLFDKYGSLLQWMHGQNRFDPLSAALPDEYFFIVLSMVVTGAVAVWRWESIFPDRRDYANLVPLPISTPNICLANLIAIVFLTLVLALDVNAASFILFPLIASGSQAAFGYVIQFAVIHVLVVMLASIFSFFAVFATVGVLMLALPHSLFQQISLYLRSAIILGLLTLLTTSFAVPSLIDAIPQAPNSPVRFLPPVWFLGLCQLLRGRAEASLSLLGWTAVAGFFCVIVIAIGVYAFSYQKYFVRIPENTEISAHATRTRNSWWFALLDHKILRSPFQRAAYRFAIRTLLRSERHALAFAAFIAVGFVVSSQILFTAFNEVGVESHTQPSAAVLSIPFIFSYCVIVGLRVVFDIPTDLRANWIFRLLLDKQLHECSALARKITLTFVLPWVWAVVFPASVYLWGWSAAILHTALITIWSILLAEILLANFRKVPFTCSYPPFRDSAIVGLLFYIFVFFVFVMVTCRLESWALQRPALMLIF